MANLAPSSSTPVLPKDESHSAEGRASGGGGAGSGGENGGGASSVSKRSNSTGKRLRRVTSAPVLALPETAASTQPQNQSRGFFGFLWRRPPRANLGEQNKFVYDRALGEWVMKDADGNTSHAGATGSGSPRGSGGGGEGGLIDDAKHQDLLEQHAITLAIQAAHEAAAWQRRGKSSSLAGGTVIYGSGRGSNQERRATPNRRLLILLVFLHSAWCAVHVALECVVPLWMLAPVHRGGLAFEPVDAALVFSFVGMVLLVLRHFTPTQLSSLPQHAPLRALRVGIGLQLVLGLLAAAVPKLGQPQNESLVVWVMLTLVLTGLASAVVLARSATSVMLQVALESKLPTATSYLVQACLMVSTAVGPMGGGASFGWALAQRTAYPMDASFVFNLCAVMCIGLYTASLVLHVHVVGDFGSAPEGAIIGWGDSDQERRCLQCPTTLLCLEEILIVPAHDVNALLVDVANADQISKRNSPSALSKEK